MQVQGCEKGLNCPEQRAGQNCTHGKMPRCGPSRNVLPPRCVIKPNCPKWDPNQMTNTERSTYSPHSNTYGSTDRAPAPDAPKDDLASKGAATFREAKANVGDMISDAGDYAGKKGRAAMDNVRGARQRALQTSARTAHFICSRSPLAFRRSTAALAVPDVSSIGSAPDPRFLRPGRPGRYPAWPVTSLPSTSETGRRAGRSGTQSRPGAVCETARGHRTRSTFRIASGMCPWTSELMPV